MDKNKNNNDFTYKKTNFDKLRAKLREKDIFNLDYKLSVNEKYDSLSNFINSAAKKCTSTITQKKNRKLMKPWADNELINLIKTKNYWYAKLKKNFENEYIKSKYKYWLNKLTKLKRKKQDSYYE